MVIRLSGRDCEGKGWLDYKWLNPATSTMEQKSTYVEKLDDMVIGCGIYK